MKICDNTNGKKTFATIVFVILVILFIVSSAYADLQRDPSASQGGVMKIGMASDPNTLNGSISGSFVDKNVAFNIFSQLTRINRDSEPVPDLAKEWFISEDGLTYTFNLVTGAKWHDGEICTSEDVKYSIEEVLLKFHPRGGVYSEYIEKVETPDPQTVVLRLKKTCGALMTMLGNDLCIIPKHLYEGTDILNNSRNLEPIGTGPFKFKEWVRGSHIILEKNTDYYIEGLPYLDYLIFSIIPDASSRVMALEAGDIDYLAYQALPTSAVPRLKNNKNFTIVQNTGLEALATILHLQLNLDNDDLKNEKLRHAIVHAMDKQYILDYANYGIGTIGTGPISSLTKWVYEPNLPKFEYNTELSKKLLDEAGYKPESDGIRLKLRLSADSGVELQRKTAEIIKEQLKLVGIDIDLQLVDRSVWMNRVYVERDFDMHVQQSSTGLDPAIDIAGKYSSTNIKPVAQSNATAYRNTQVDELLEKGGSAIKTEDRAMYYKEMQKIITADQPAVFLIEPALLAIWNNRIHGVHTWNAYSYYCFMDAWYQE